MRSGFSDCEDPYKVLFQRSYSLCGVEIAELVIFSIKLFKIQEALEGDAVFSLWATVDNCDFHSWLSFDVFYH